MKIVRALFLLLIWELLYGGSRLWSPSASGKYIKTACKLPEAVVRTQHHADASGYGFLARGRGYVYGGSIVS